jgi:hypothetical protein
MRALVRSVVIWLVGFPLSVIVSSAVIASMYLALAAVEQWNGADGARSFAEAQRTFFNVWPVVAVFSALPVLVTWMKARNDVRSLSYFVANGARTGLWCGIIAMIAFIPFALLASVGALAALAGGGNAETQAMAGMVLAVGGVIGFFALAGAAGGAVFGAVSEFAHSAFASG